MTAPVRILVLCAALPLLALALPQPEGCGRDRETDALRQVGDSWSPDGCNNCRCLASGQPGCTRRLCSDQHLWPASRSCSEGARWEEKTGPSRKVCRCNQGSPDCSALVVTRDPARARCWSALLGEEKDVGDVWKEACNTCHCTEEGPGCTKLLCLSGLGHCTDRQGLQREPGATWAVQRAGQTNDCECKGGLVLCKARLQLETTTRTFGLGLNIPETRINFPGAGGIQRQVAAVCLDAEGQERADGEAWKQACNTCRCLGDKVSCTRRLCLGAGPSPPKVKAPAVVTKGTLLEVVEEAATARQCEQDGVTRCRQVRVAPGLQLNSLKSGAVLGLLPGAGLAMKLTRDPAVTPSGSLTLSWVLQDGAGGHGGEALVTVATSGSMFGSVRPVARNTLYTLESCGGGCSVLLERPAGWFNQFQD